jgi:hypothetical protein
MKIKKLIIIGFIALGISVFFAKNSYALVYPDSFYDNISWTWYYADAATSLYNCLGYATGNRTWEWPSSWGSTATKAQVDSYLSTLGYRPSAYDPFILAYGSSQNSITHFSKVTGLQWCRAKWGSLELFNHGSHDPYYSSSSYGDLQIKYTAN